MVLPGPFSVSRVTLSIAPCLLCWRRSLSPWCWRRILGGSTLPSCSITWGSYSVGPSKPSTWDFVVPAFGPGFHFGRSPGHTCPSWTPAWRLTPLSFLRPFIGARWDPLSKGWYSPLMFPFSPPGNFWLTCSAIQFRYIVSLLLYLLDLLLTFAPSTFLPGLGSRLVGEQASFLLPPLGFWHQITSTSSLAVHQRVTSHLRWICLFYSSVSICQNKWCSYLARTYFS